MKQIFIILGGITSSIFTVIIVYIVQKIWSTDLTSIMYFFIVPVGAVCAGAVSASGYYFMGRLTNTPVNKLLLVNMLFIGLSTYFLIELVMYNTMTLSDGIKLNTIVSFWDYYKTSVESTQLELMKSHDIVTGALGKIGYLYEFIRIIGYLSGGFWIYDDLSKQPYCKNCTVYFKKIKEQNYLSADKFNNFLQKCGLVFDGLVGLINSALSNRKSFYLNVKLYECKNCYQKMFRFSSGDDIIKDYSYDGDFNYSLLDNTEEPPYDNIINKNFTYYLRLCFPMFRVLIVVLMLAIFFPALILILTSYENISKSNSNNILEPLAYTISTIAIYSLLIYLFRKVNRSFGPDSKY